jgi:predicted dehydrogenase
MNGGWPPIDFGHTGVDAAFARGDVYAVSPDPARGAKRPLRIALAGAGGVAQAKWIPAVRRLQAMGEPVAIAGVADLRADVAAKAAMLAGASPYGDAAAMMDTERPDLLLVLTADAGHVPVAGAAIERGIPCLVEKPLAPDFTAAAALVRRASDRGVLLAAVANKRFSPPYSLARALVAEGRLRAPPTVFTGKFTLGYPYVDLLAGGTVHLLDLMLWFMGPVSQLRARGVMRDGGIESAVVALGFESGAIGTIMTSAAGLSFKPWERVEIFGRNAFLVVDDQWQTTLYDEETGPAKSWAPVLPNTLMFDEAFGGYSGLLDNVLDAVRGAVPLGAPAVDGANAIGLIEAIRRSVAEDRELDVASEGLVV